MSAQKQKAEDRSSYLEDANTLKKKFAVLENPTALTDSIHKKISALPKTPQKQFKKETLVAHGATQGMVGNRSVVAFPMHVGGWHCVNYTEYPKQPRFFTATTNKAQRPKLGFLGVKCFNAQADTVYLLEGLWDMLRMYEEGYNVLALPGVNNYSEEWESYLTGKNVIMLFDNDEPGKDFAQRHAQKILHVTKTLRVVLLPSKVTFSKKKHEVKDVSDLFAIDAAFAKDLLSKLIVEAEPQTVDVRTRIDEVMTGRGTNVMRSMVISDLILEDIDASGGSIIPYNERQEFALVTEGKYIITDEKIDVYLAEQYGYIPSDPMWRYVRERLYNLALQTKKHARINLYSAMTPDKCYIGTKDSGMLCIEQDAVTVVPQGTDNLYIKSANRFNGNMQAMLKAQDKKGMTLDDVLNLFDYDDVAEQQKFLLKAWFYHSFFDPKMRVTLCITGDPGSGKTLLQKMLKGILFGFNDDIPSPNSLPDEDYVFTGMVKSFRYMFLDEVNNTNPAFKTKLRMLATGEETVFRPKYARASIKFRPRVWLVISSHSPRFRDSDIAQRLCIIRLLHPGVSKPLINEGEFFALMEERRGEIWRDIVTTMQSIITNLRTNAGKRIPLTNYCRQVELANFAYQAFPKQSKLCINTFDAMNREQELFSAEFDPILDLIEVWLQKYGRTHIKDDKVNVEGRKLYDEMSMIARERQIRNFPSSVHGFGKWIHNRSGIFKDMYGYERIRDTGRSVWHYRFSPSVIEPEKF